MASGAATGNFVIEPKLHLQNDDVQNGCASERRTDTDKRELW
jgi:hypothetical protein